MKTAYFALFCFVMAVGCTASTTDTSGEVSSSSTGETPGSPEGNASTAGGGIQGTGSNPRAGIPCEEWWECWPDHTLQCIEGFCTEAPNPALGEPCSDGGDCWSKHGLVCAGGTCVEPECQEDSDCEDDMFCSYGKCFMPPCIVYCAPCGDFYCDEGYLNGYSCSECWDNLGSDGDNWDTQEPDATEDVTESQPVPWSIEACGILWPSDPFQAAVYAFVAEYVLGLGPMVGCYQDSYPDPLFMDVAEALENGWSGGSPADGLAYAQEWVDNNASNAGKETFDLAEVFGIDTLPEGNGQGGGGTEVNCEPPLNETLPDELPQNAFQVVDNPMQGEPGMTCMTRYVDVFGLSVVAEGGLSNAQILHAANVLAELLDNDENGEVDDPALLAQLQSVKGLFPLFNYDGSPGMNDMMSNFSNAGTSAVLYANEVDPENPGKFGSDATVEEILHTINHRGHAVIYPDAFGITPNSSLLTAAMDVARGGQFLSVPESYPEASWYHYDDVTCDYGCMAIEYIYWAIVTNMGLLDDPATCQGISNEWEACSKDALATTDVLVYELITDPAYKLPQLAPNGVYAP